MIQPGARTRRPDSRAILTNNARSETVATRPTYRAWAAGRRCLVPASWYQEPNWETGRNVWWRMRRADGEPWAIAGLWSEWTDPATGEIVPNYTMITVNCDGIRCSGACTSPSRSCRRMPRTSARSCRSSAATGAPGSPDRTRPRGRCWRRRRPNASISGRRHTPTRCCTRRPCAARPARPAPAATCAPRSHHESRFRQPDRDRRGADARAAPRADPTGSSTTRGPIGWCRLRRAKSSTTWCAASMASPGAVTDAAARQAAVDALLRGNAAYPNVIPCARGTPRTRCTARWRAACGSTCWSAPVRQLCAAPAARSGRSDRHRDRPSGDAVAQAAVR